MTDTVPGEAGSVSVESYSKLEGASTDVDIRFSAILWAARRECSDVVLLVGAGGATGSIFGGALGSRCSRGRITVLSSIGIG